MIYIHADDFGVNFEQTKRILSCKVGGLNSVSIFPNSPHLKEQIDLIPSEFKKSIHLNLVEGKCCANKDSLSLLVSEEGCFNRSFLELLILSLLHPCKFRKQVKMEIATQLDKVLCILPETYQLRVDSHEHCHMIPAIFMCLCQLLDEKKIDVEYIRWPIEPIGPLLTSVHEWRNIKSINILKRIVLRVFSWRDLWINKKYRYQMKDTLFLGLTFSGEMIAENIKNFYYKYIKLSNKKHKDLEVLFHPGGIKEGEDFLDDKNDVCKAFYMSDNREYERKAILEMGKQQ